jgi:hypothetical protein
VTSSSIHAGDRPVAGFLAATAAARGGSYATDLRLYAAWCHEASLSLFGVRP